MLYLMAEIWIYLLIAALLGFLAAWLVARARAQDLIDRAEGSWKARLRANEDEWSQKLKAAENRLQRDVEERERQTTVLTEQLQGERERSGGLNDRLAEEAASYQSVKDELDRTLAKLRMYDERLAIALERGDIAEVELRKAKADFEARLEDHKQELDEAKAALKEARETRLDMEKELAAGRRAMEEAGVVPVSDGSGVSDATVSELRAARKDLERREQRIRELEPLQDRVRELEDQISLTEREYLAELERKLEEVERLRSEKEELQLRLDKAAEDAERNGDIATAPPTSDGGMERLELRIAAAVQDLPDLDALLDRSEGASSSQARRALAGSEEAAIGGDDLRRIRGIGPVLKRKLKQMGYRTFEQIANWDESDINRVCEVLPIFPDRIRREEWVEQARELSGHGRDRVQSG